MAGLGESYHGEGASPLPAQSSDSLARSFIRIIGAKNSIGRDFGLITFFGKMVNAILEEDVFTDFSIKHIKAAHELESSMATGRIDLCAAWRASFGFVLTNLTGWNGPGYASVQALAYPNQQPHYTFRG